MPHTMECVNFEECGHSITTEHNTWDEATGWGILFGSLAVCSRECAVKWATEHSKYGCLPEGELFMMRHLQEEEHVGSPS